MNKVIIKKPEHESIYLQLKELILFGEVVPGQPVTIHGLAETVGAGVTPVREGIRRLTAEGALAVLENRRVVVPAMTNSWLDQIELARLTLEPELAELGAKRTEIHDIIELERLDGLVNLAIRKGDIRGYLEANYRFHFALYDIADALILKRIAETLWLRVGPSLRVVCGRIGTSNLTDHHQEATSGLRDGDFDKVKQAFREDIRQGMAFIRQTIEDK
jgi:DNA-binding GntR family transcriptional regulator